MKNSVYSISFKNFFSSENTSLNISFVSVLSGLISGVTVYIFIDSDIKEKISYLFFEFYSVFSDKTSIEIFSGIALYGIIYFTAMFILGGSIFGKTILPALTFFKAMGITILACYFYNKYSMNGLQYALLVFFPGKFILIAAMLILTKICFETSRDILSFEKCEKAQLIRIYAIKGCITFFLFFFSWIIDFICIEIFSDLFEFT